MDDYSIVKDDYFYIREQAFRDIASVARATPVHSIREEDSEKKPGGPSSHRPDPESKATRRLHCPFDGSLMRTMPVEQVRIDYCPSCFGIWFDLGELETLLRRKTDILSRFGEVFDHSLKIHKQPAPDCPVCRKKMVPHRHYYANLKSLGCENCGGLWLDSGEFAALYLERKQSASAASLLSEVLGKHIDIRM